MPDRGFARCGARRVDKRYSPRMQVTGRDRIGFELGPVQRDGERWSIDLATRVASPDGVRKLCVQVSSDGHHQRIASDAIEFLLRLGTPRVEIGRICALAEAVAVARFRALPGFPGEGPNGPVW